MEGVLMRGMRHAVAAMRTPKGTIEVVHEELKGIYKTRLRDIPFLRGLVILWDSLGLGMKFLIVSANLQTDENEKIEGPEVVLSILFALVVSIALFFLAPAGVALLLERFLSVPNWLGNVVEGILRLAIVLGYMGSVSKIEEIKRVFRYHGGSKTGVQRISNFTDLKTFSILNFLPSFRYPASDRTDGKTRR